MPHAISNHGAHLQSSGDNHPFWFLDSLINILIVDDNLLSQQLLTELLSPVTCFSLYHASSNSSALTQLRSGKRFHTCIIDLGIDDVENDEFYLLRHYANHCSMLVLTGSSSPRKGATCIQLGARAVVDKGALFNNRVFFTTLCSATITSIVNHRYHDYAGDTLNLATKILFEKNPETVTAWADLMRITDRQMRNLWHAGSGFGAKQVLFLYQLLHNTSTYYDAMLFGDRKEQESAEHLATPRFTSYFNTHKEIITFLLT